MIFSILLSVSGGVSSISLTYSSTDAPYKSSAVVKYDSNPLFSAIILAPGYVLTVDKFDPGDYDIADTLRVTTNMSSTAFGRRDYDVEDILHSDENLSNFVLLSLRDPIVYGNGVGPARINPRDEVATTGNAILVCWTGSSIYDIKQVSTKFRILSTEDCKLRREEELIPDDYICLELPHTSIVPKCAAGSFGGGVFVGGYLVAIVDTIPLGGYKHNEVAFFPKISAADKYWIRQKIGLIN
ncbi:hypothetical protein QAD02_005083 [Eretmocerus hayati]|uniref:Uncharacterized protein n=1 Tax=Eretmocerus hayati TaxID=131215 RepID=A0ACC2NRQ5_9HYME|nr:hypothetical protein QAD02_005083 [Eretmocerus hayati]